MSRKAVLLGAFLSALFVLIGASAWPASAAHHESPFGKAFMFSVVNFTILAMALYFLLRKPVAEFFRKRATTTKLEMEKARQYYEEARRQYQEIDGKLRAADAEGKKLLESLRMEGEAEKVEILKQARELAGKIGEDAVRIAEQEVRKATAQLKAETAVLAAEIAAKTIEARLGVEDQKRLAEEFVVELREVKRPG